jgi:hypothetical protein
MDGEVEEESEGESEGKGAGSVLIHLDCCMGLVWEGTREGTRREAKDIQ